MTDAGIRVPRPVGDNNIKVTGSNPASFLIVILSAFAIFFGAQLIGAVIVSVAGSVLGYDPKAVTDAMGNNDLVRFLLTFLIEVITVWLVYRTLKSSKLTLKSISLSKKPNFGNLLQAVKGYVIYFVIFLSIFSVIGYLGLINTDQAQELGFSNPTGIGLVFAFISLVILPPIAEEILFRGYLYQRLKVHSANLAMIITSLLFATAHLEFGSGNPLNWSAALDTLILSFVLIYLTNKTKSLWPAIFLHSIKNCIAFVTLFVLK